MSTKRLNLTVDAAAAEILERMAGGRNKMGDYLSRLLIDMDAGTPAADLDRMDKESLRLMLQGVIGRLSMVEGEVLRMQAQLAALIAGERLRDEV